MPPSARALVVAFVVASASFSSGCATHFTLKLHENAKRRSLPTTVERAFYDRSGHLHLVVDFQCGYRHWVEIDAFGATAHERTDHGHDLRALPDAADELFVEALEPDRFFARGPPTSDGGEPRLAFAVKDNGFMFFELARVRMPPIRFSLAWVNEPNRSRVLGTSLLLPLAIAVDMATLPVQVPLICILMITGLPPGRFG